MKKAHCASVVVFNSKKNPKQLKQREGNQNQTKQRNHTPPPKSSNPQNAEIVGYYTGFELEPVLNNFFKYSKT